MARKMGAIPFFSKWNQKRRFAKLEKKADKLKDKFCDLATDVEKEKERAASILTKQDYEKITDKVDERLSQVQECALSAEEAPEGGSVAMEKDCRKIAAKKIGRKDARGLKKGSPEHAKWEKLTRECVEKGGGGTV